MGNYFCHPHSQGVMELRLGLKKIIPSMIFKSVPSSTSFLLSSHTEQNLKRRQKLSKVVLFVRFWFGAIFSDSQSSFAQGSLLVMLRGSTGYQESYPSQTLAEQELNPLHTLFCFKQFLLIYYVEGERSRK